MLRAGHERLGSGRVLGFLDGRLARYKIPKSVQFADRLPRTATGKILKPTQLARDPSEETTDMSTAVNGLDEITALAGADLGTQRAGSEVTQERINTFADATGDHQWIHVDPARAAPARSAAPSRTATSPCPWSSRCSPSCSTVDRRSAWASTTG